ncbi:MAG: hypothetical protein EXS14_08445 [Planctomycetes bacterium]|nr:hypothetical protein [Planctomycetota bacterium]
MHAPENEHTAESVAGWFDGHRAGRAQTFNLLVDQLAPHGLSMEHDEVLRNDGTVAPRFVVPEPDNVASDPHYADGFENGYAAARARLVLHVREQLAAHELFLSDGLRVLSHAETSDCVDGLWLAHESQMCSVSRTPSSREGGIWSMVVNNFSRRAAIIAFGSTIVAGSLGWIGAMQLARPAPLPSPPTWTAPVTWDGDATFVRQLLLSIDQNAWTLEQAEGIPSPTLLTQMQGCFALPGPTGDLGRQLYCRWLAEQDRTEYVTALITQLNPATQNADTRIGILKAVGLLHENNTPSLITSAQRQALQAYQATQTEDDEVAYGILERLVDTLVAAGI